MYIENLTETNTIIFSDNNASLKFQTACKQTNTQKKAIH